MRTQALGHGLVAQSQRALAPFRLVRPQSMTELRHALDTYPQATLVAGSTDVFARIREGLAPEVVIGLRGIPELASVKHAGGELRLGATVTHHAGSRCDVVADAVPGMASAWSSIATVRIRRSATLGGNLMARRVRYELPVVFGALDARMEFLDGRSVPVRDLSDEGPATRGCLVAVAVPTPDLLWFGYDRSLRPITTLALALRRTGSGLAVAATVGSELTRPVTLTAGRAAPDLRDLAGLGPELAAGLPEEIADYNGSAEYRRHVAGVQIDRLLARAATDDAEEPRAVRSETGAAR